jgi:uncharacterized protein
MNAVDRLRENGIVFDFSELTNIAKRYSVETLAEFGSSHRSDIRSDSDVDLLVTFESNAEISLFDIMDLERDLEKLFHRAVDLVEPAALTNPIRRQNILSTSEPLYAA